MVDFGAGVGSEQSGVRPALVISNDGFNRRFPLATILPFMKLAGKQRSTYPFEIVMPAGIAGNPVASIVMPHQARTVSRRRLLRRIGRLGAPHLQAEIEDRLLDHFGVGFETDDD